jgi:hypothetical protein
MVREGDEQYMNIVGFFFFPKYWRNLRLTGLIPLYKSIIFLLMHKMDSDVVDQWKQLLSILYKVY